MLKYVVEAFFFMDARKFYKELLKPLLVLLGAIMFWRGTWMLLDYFLFPRAPLLSAAISAFLGLDILLITHELERMV